MSKFISSLTSGNEGIKQQRAELLNEQTKLEVESLITNLSRQKSEISNQISKLTDLAPDNSYSLRPGGNEYNPAKWVQELHRLCIAKKLKQIELDEAVAIKEEWFKEEPETKA